MLMHTNPLSAAGDDDDIVKNDAQEANGINDKLHGVRLSYLKFIFQQVAGQQCLHTERLRCSVYCFA